MRLNYIVTLLIVTLLSHHVSAQTAQERFDAGSLALENQQYEEALKVFEGLESLSIKNKDVQSVIKIRKGEALFYLGRAIDAQTYFADAISVIDHLSQNYQTDIFSANTLLGKIAIRQFDYRAAAQYYQEAGKAAPNNTAKLNALAGATMAAMFVDTDDALRIALEANKLAISTNNVDKEIKAQSNMLLGRVYLNRQEHIKARRQFSKAVTKLGGLTRRVKLNDIQARSDHATASALLDDPQSMRHYLSYTGAGRFEGSAFLKASDVQLPACDPANGIMPEDVVIVELGITQKGEVLYSRPIYSNKPTKIALTFAKAVKNWSWTQEEVATIDPFYRALTRLELRCTQKTPAQPSPKASLAPIFYDWIGKEFFLRPKGLSNAAFATNLLEAEQKIYEANEADKKAISIWTLLASNNAVTFNKRNIYANRALEAAKAMNAPSEVQVFLSLLQIFDHRDKSIEAIKAMKADTGLNTNSIVNAVLALTINDNVKRGANSDYVVELLREVIDDPSLPNKHPLKIGAQIRLASLYQQLGSEDYARETFQQTGLSADQCAAIDSKPKLLSTGSLSKLYPTDMLRMSITGFSKAEYDITAEGKVVNQRIVMAYPPFGFTKASEKIIARGKYEKSYRPDGGLGCSNDTNFIRFNIPGSKS